MEHEVQNSSQLLELSVNQELYESLVLQLQKDFALANNPLNINIDIKSEELIKVLVEKIYFLMMERFCDVLNRQDHRIRSLGMEQSGLNDFHATP